MTKIIQAAALSCVVLLFSACSLPAYKQLQDAGQSYQIVASASFKHLLAVNSHVQALKPVVIFIEGDGKPWYSRSRVAFEPTPDQPLLLGWFLSADFPAMYLGRPCYFALADEKCAAYWYTHGRYSESVVSSLVHVVNEHVTNQDIVLVGHSGGGTLAMLMAEQLANVTAVITIAGNLQVNVWTDYHQYSRLQGSLDPDNRDALPASIRQAHFYSPFDQVIKAQWIKDFAAKQHNASLIELPVYGHNHAWNAFYPAFRKTLLQLTENSVGANIE